jgi:REP element-mobilizing transposase RayT
MRAVARERIFVDDTDRSRFLWQLEEVTRRWGWRVVCWCLLGTHFHLVIEAEREQMSIAVHRLACLYAMYFNRRHERRGHLFENRFSSWMIRDEEHLEATILYVVENPVRAGLCQTSTEWQWSWPRLERPSQTSWPGTGGSA